jgi:hypothetical protein
VSEAPRQSGPATAQLTLFGGASGLGAAVTTRKFFHPARGIDEFLLAREKRVARGADADFNVTPGRTGMINRAACANDVGLYVFRMNVRFHVQKGARNLRGMGDFRKR